MKIITAQEAARYVCYLKILVRHAWKIRVGARGPAIYSAAADRHRAGLKAELDRAQRIVLALALRATVTAKGGAR